MTRTGADAESYARSRVGSYMPDTGLCLQCTRQNFDADALYASAADQWDNAAVRHTSRPPAGAVVPVYWDTPSPYNHVATFLSNGQVVTTDGARIELWSSIDAISSAYGGPYLGWTEDIEAVRVYGGDTPPEPSPTPEDDMTYKAYTTKRGLDLKAGTWTTIRLDDAGDLSICDGPTHFSVVTQVTAENLPGGHQLAVRFKTVDVKSGSDTKRVATFPTTELVGTGGDTQGTAPQIGSIGSAASGWSRRLRVEAMTYDDDVVVSSAQTRVLYR